MVGLGVDVGRLLLLLLGFVGVCCIRVAILAFSSLCFVPPICFWAVVYLLTDPALQLESCLWARS